jgi:hypothetical protein
MRHDMQYVMNDLEKELYKLTADEGNRAPVKYTIRAMLELGHTMSDLGLAERARKVFAAADQLKELLDKIEE